MRKTLLLAAALLTACVTSSLAMKTTLRDASEVTEWESLLQYDLGDPVTSHTDTVYFGGSGNGLGSIVRGGNWDWEASSGETAEFFDPPFNTDPVGNQFRDGWTFVDRTTRNGPSQIGTGHWSTAGVYNFNIDGQAYAHRATTHTNTGGNDGPNPLVEPGQGGAWSIWIGTNLFLNPENCAWSGGDGGEFPFGAGYDDGWSQGIQKSYAINQPQGTAIDIRFYHKYSVENGFDTNRVEISTDGVFWNQVGNRTNANGIFQGGDASCGWPDTINCDGDPAIVTLFPQGEFGWPGGAGTLFVRFRLSSDGFFSDNSQGGLFLYAWQLDNIQLLVAGTPVEAMATFETGYSGWEPRQFEGYDFQLTASLRPVGRITSLGSIFCQPLPPCPETCDFEGNVLMFADKDDCDYGDQFQDSFLHSRAFAIGGPANPDLDGDEGRMLVFDWYVDGGVGRFETGPAFCIIYWPYNANNCPYSPPAGAPGNGSTFNWGQTNFTNCFYFIQGSGASCLDDGIIGLSSSVPGDADSVILFVGGFSTCRSEPDPNTGCQLQDRGAPFWDNIRFGVFNPGGTALDSATLDRYSDNFSTTNTGFPLTATSRSDGAHSLSQNLGAELPFRWVRSDTAVANATAPNSSVHLRFRVTPGPCQPNMGHNFFTTYPPNVWHSARMDTGASHGNGLVEPGTWMTCFHEDDPLDGHVWPPPATPPLAVEPCDDILPDGLFTAGTKVEYFFEIHNPPNGPVTGTFPFARNANPISTDPRFKDLWLEYETLPELVSQPSCNGELTNNLLLVMDYQTQGVPGRGLEQRRRLQVTLQGMGVGFDTYDCMGTNYSSSYNGIGRREDRAGQAPRPPMNGATDLQLIPYEVIWVSEGLSETGTLSDRLTSVLPPGAGGQPSDDQQTLETWTEGCTAGNNRTLIIDGVGWAWDTDQNTNHGASFLSRYGVDALGRDYAQDVATVDDLRRCARITRRLAGGGPDLFDDGEVLGSGCPDDIDIGVLGAISGGEAVANFVESGEDGNDPVSCANDTDQLAWHAVIRKADAAEPCERSVFMSFAFAELLDLNCNPADECVPEDFRIDGENQDLLLEMFAWIGKATDPIGIGEPAASPRLVNALYQAQPNPANPSALIRYAIAEKGHVALRIFDVSGRLVRTLVDKEQAPDEKGFEVVWDGLNDAGHRVGSGVFFYQIDAPGFHSAKKLVILK